jgi:hypothetical protein
MKTPLIIFFFPMLFLYAQNEEMIAILDFQAQSPVSTAQAKFVSDGLKRQFKATEKYIVLDKWMIDTILSEQGFNKTHTCINEQCLIAIGHLLTVKKVLGGLVAIKGKNVELSALMVDVEANALVSSATVTIPVTQKKLKDQDVTVFFKAIMAKKNIIPLNTQKSGPTTSANVPEDQFEKTSHETSLFKKKGFWMTASACVIGAAVVSTYYFLRASKGRGSEPDTGLSLNDAPSR